MKKIFFAVLSIASISGVFGYVNGHKSSTELSSLQMENLEALSVDGEGGAIWIPCSNPEGSCTFSAQTADGQVGTVTVKGLSKAPYTI